MILQPTRTDAAGMITLLPVHPPPLPTRRGDAGPTLSPLSFSRRAVPGVMRNCGRGGRGLRSVLLLVACLHVHHVAQAAPHRAARGEAALPVGRPLGRRHTDSGSVTRVAAADTAAAAVAAASARLGAKDCTTRYITQDLDHFSWESPSPGNVTSFAQRYMVHDAFWHAGGPIFFYTGNEADVELYANNTGLMWENAEEFGALVVFAEHRYYGHSQPFGTYTTGGDDAKWDPAKLRFLTHEQALADYAVLIYHLRTAFKGGAGAASPVVAFGGSYGGMLAAWLRLKYPGSVIGAVAASAPVLAFPGMSPTFDAETYWGVVTRDASDAIAGCDRLVRRAFTTLFAASAVELTHAFRLCTPLQQLGTGTANRGTQEPGTRTVESGGTHPELGRGESDPEDAKSRLAMFLAVAFDTMAMGSYPYPSNYMTGGGDAPKLPPWPITAACRAMVNAVSSPGDKKVQDHNAAAENAVESMALLEGLRDAAGVFNNASGSAVGQSPPRVSTHATPPTHFTVLPVDPFRRPTRTDRFTPPIHPS